MKLATEYWATLEREIHGCELCPRLRDHCEETARTKRKSYRDETYWGKPVASFGDPDPSLVIVGLAPAAHGANRTGRVFTGDRSGEWLYRALYETGFASQPESIGSGDGMKLNRARILCSVKCAPPDNKPTPQEKSTCIGRFTQREFNLCRDLGQGRKQVWLCLGAIAFETWKKWYLQESGATNLVFKHGGIHELDLNGDGAKNTLLITSYHPSQQNTFTGRLKWDEFLGCFIKAREWLDLSLIL